MSFFQVLTWIDTLISFSHQVKEGKTSYKHGYDQLYLLPDEYAWLVKLNELRVLKLKKARTVKYLFTNTGKGEVRLVNNIREAWEEMGLPGSPDCMAIRTAVCTYVSLELCYLLCFLGFSRFALYEQIGLCEVLCISIEYKRCYTNKRIGSVLLFSEHGGYSRVCPETRR